MNTALIAFAAVLLSILVFGGRAAAAPPPGLADGRVFKAHMAFLADDLLEGRETGMRGFDIAAKYVAGQFAQYGVQPRGDKGGYLQALPLKTGRLVQESPVFEIRRPGGAEALVYLTDFSMGPQLSTDQSDFSAPLVFAGYGVTAPAFQHDDYAGLDVKGKIVVVLGDYPPSFPSEVGAHYNNRKVKGDIAAKNGAVGVITLQTPRGERVSPFSNVRQYANSLSMDWLTAEGRGSRDTPGLQGGAFLSMAAAAKLFSEVDVKLAGIYAAVEAKQPLPHMPLKLSARLAQATTRANVSSTNVVGMIEGSDPVLKKEFVVFSAHLDHLGVRQGMTADNTFNGAMDNASGVSTLLEMARLVAQMPVKPKRSILFIALTGEEKGLLGSDFFAQNPSVPQAAIAACVNLDMPILLYDFSAVTAFGAERSNLNDALARAAAELKLTVVPDPFPEQGIFTRSDHYSFVRQGVPSIYVTPGFASARKEENAAQIAGNFLTTHYHKVSDDMNLPLNFEAAARYAQLNYYLGVEIANSAQPIAWVKGDFFGELFKK